MNGFNENNKGKPNGIADEVGSLFASEMHCGTGKYDTEAQKSTKKTRDEEHKMKAVLSNYEAVVGPDAKPVGYSLKVNTPAEKEKSQSLQGAIIDLTGVEPVALYRASTLLGSVVSVFKSETDVLSKQSIGTVGFQAALDALIDAYRTQFSSGINKHKRYQYMLACLRTLDAYKHRPYSAEYICTLLHLQQYHSECYAFPRAPANKE